MTEPFTIRIFVPNGDPEGVRIVDLMNWTGKGIIFPRAEWNTIAQRPEFQQPGIYILVGQDGQEQEDDLSDLPSLYIGQTDGLRKRLDKHDDEKLFWDRAIVFVSRSDGLNRGHLTWLEWSLIKRAKEIQQCHLMNESIPNEPTLSESEKADTTAFLKQVLQILPLVGLRALEKRKAITAPPAPPVGIDTEEVDTIVVPAKKDSFDRLFIGEDRWHAIHISGGRLPKIRYIAAYQSAPLSAITHYAPVDRIEPYGEEGKYQIVFAQKAQPIDPNIPFADSPQGTIQAPRYTNLAKLLNAKKVLEVFA